MSNTGTNGRAQRKSLATQLDRLDVILDGLADGLNEAVATAVAAAVTEAVGKAVEVVLREVLAAAEVQRRLRPEPVPTVPTPAAPGLVRRAAWALGRGLRGCWSWVAGVTMVGASGSRPWRVASGAG
jgi:hypothetical protein